MQSALNRNFNEIFVKICEILVNNFNCMVKRGELIGIPGILKG